MDLDLAATDKADPAIRRFIRRELVEMNDRHAGEAANFRRLVVPLRKPGTDRVVGGLWGETGRRWLFVDLLFVPDAMRGARVGTALMRTAETEAIARGCIGSWLDTYSFQARGFYEKLGYAAFGTLEDYPPGHRRFFMAKRFDGVAAESQAKARLP